MTDQEYCIFSQLLVLKELHKEMVKKEPDRTQTARKFILHRIMEIEILWNRITYLKKTGISA